MWNKFLTDSNELSCSTCKDKKVETYGSLIIKQNWLY